jgi:hypothetical protein
MTSTSRSVRWLLVLVGATCAMAAASKLPFIQDDYPNALLAAPGSGSSRSLLKSGLLGDRRAT